MSVVSELSHYFVYSILLKFNKKAFKNGQIIPLVVLFALLHCTELNFLRCYVPIILQELHIQATILKSMLWKH